VEARAERATSWLVETADPAVAALARRDLHGERVAPAAAMSSPIVNGLLVDLTDWSSRPYAKWRGAHWRLVSLVELGLPAGEPSARSVCQAVLGFWADPRRLAAVPVVDGRTRRHASQEGNAIAVACRLGLADDPRVALLVEHLLASQWPDGGWNCDMRPTATHSSFHETLSTLWGLHEYAAVSGDGKCLEAVRLAGELLLQHHVVFAAGGAGAPVHPSFVDPHYPPYWHYDVLQALLVLHRAGLGSDPRTRRARQLVAARRRRDGMWRAGRRWWRPPGAGGSGVEAVDWGDVAHQMVTLNALRVEAHRART